MSETKEQSIRVRFPSNIGYVSPVRNLISELLQVRDYSRKFAYRSEVIVDEVCSNAIQYGSKKENSTVDLACLISGEKFEIHVQDQGGSKSDVERLKEAVESENINLNEEVTKIKKLARGGFGLEIVRMLSEEVELKIGENNMTTLRVVRNKSNA